MPDGGRRARQVQDAFTPGPGSLVCPGCGEPVYSSQSLLLGDGWIGHALCATAIAELRSSGELP